MELEWPLNLVVTNASLARYNGLFSFLLNIKRVQIDLQQAFTLCKGGSGLASEERVLKWRENDSFGGHGHHAFGAPVSSQALHLRTNMAFLVDNVQYYLMVDVLGAQYALLQSRVAGSKDFEALKTAHDVFLSTLEAQSLINIQVVERALDDIFSLCRRFCSELRRLTDAQAAAGAAALPPEDGPPLITKLAKDYERASCFLFTILQSFQNKQAAPHLSQLLLRIDYNRHFSKAAARIGGSQLATSSQALHELRV
jgi:gamma-tubulin complex component 4